MNGDRLRALATAAGAAALVGVPTLGPLVLGTEEGADVLDTAITPPDYTFAVWGPIFASCLVSAARQLRPNQLHRADHRVSGWPLTAAYTLNAAWSIAAQRKAWPLTPILLPAAAAAALIAHRRLQDADRGESATTVSTGMLLGWTALAATINLAAAPSLVGANPDSKTSTLASAGSAVGASVGLAALITHSHRGYLPLAATSLWGLTTAATSRGRSPLARAGLATGATIIGTATARRALRQRRSAASPGGPA